MPEPQLHISLAKLSRYTLLIMAVTVSFLFSPAPKSEKDYCGQYIHLGKYAGFTFNCDAADYCMNAKNPARMLTDSAVRQSRPLYPIAAAAMGHPLQWLVDKSNLAIFHSMGDEAEMYIGYYIGYILLNFLLILFSLFLFGAIVAYISDNKINKWILLAFQVLIISNEVTKAFFWTAHQQFFALFTPLLTIYLYLKISSTGKTLKNMGGISIALGLCMLTYGNFLPMFFCLLWAAHRVDKKMYPLHTLKNICLFLLPTLLWMSFCIMINGTYYNHEIAKYRQVVWIADTLSISIGEFLSVFTQNFLLYMDTFRAIGLFLLITLGFGSYALAKGNTEYKKVLPTLSVIFIIYFCFYLVLGFYQPRLTFTLFPICIVSVFTAISGSGQLRKNGVVYLLLALGWHLYNLASYGPFS